MIGTSFYKPLEPDKLTRTVMHTVNREAERLQPVYNDSGLLMGYQTAIETVTEEMPALEEYDNPAPNTYTKYREAAQWCNDHGAQMVDCGAYYEVQTIAVPTEEDARRSEIATRLAELQDYLRSTDWYAVRFADSGVEMPASVKQARQEARDEIDTLRAELEALAEQPAG